MASSSERFAPCSKLRTKLTCVSVNACLSGNLVFIAPAHREYIRVGALSKPSIPLKTSSKLLEVFPIFDRNPTPDSNKEFPNHRVHEESPCERTPSSASLSLINFSIASLSVMSPRYPFVYANSLSSCILSSRVADTIISSKGSFPPLPSAVLLNTPLILVLALGVLNINPKAPPQNVPANSLSSSAIDPAIDPATVPATACGTFHSFNFSAISCVLGAVVTLSVYADALPLFTVICFGFLALDVSSISRNLPFTSIASIPSRIISLIGRSPLTGFCMFRKDPTPLGSASLHNPSGPLTYFFMSVTFLLI